MRLEPNNQEVKKQYADAKSLYEKVSKQVVPVLWIYDITNTKSHGFDIYYFLFLIAT
jgi:hypothetical protein